jgi:hypothetical protein
MPLGYPNRGTFNMSFKSLSLLEGADEFEGLTSLNINTTIDGRERPYGNGMRPYAPTRGNLVIEVEAKFLLDYAHDFIKGHPQFLTEIFNFTVVNEEGPRRHVVQLKDVTFEGCDMPAEGTGPSEITFSGSASDIMINGQSVIDDTRDPDGGV